MNGPRPNASTHPPWRRKQPEVSWREKFLAVLQSEPLANGAVAVAIAVGFFHGWLKIKVPHAFTTFAFDFFLVAALLVVFLRPARGASFFPAGSIGKALKAFYVLAVLYLAIPLPDSPPLLVGLASLRAWCFATLMFCLGYRISHSINQVKGYFYVLILLGVLTAVYGIRQSPEEVAKQMDEDAVFAERYKFTYYATSTGKQELRRFSTFISSGAFGSTLAYVTIFAIALISDPKAGNRERLLLGLATLPIVYAMVLSGARSAMVSLGCGFLIIAWFRRNVLNFVVIPAILLLAIKLGAEYTGGSAAERFSTLLRFEEIIARQIIPTQIGVDYMKDNLLGGGVGKGGLGLPAFLVTRYSSYDFVRSDGDLGRLMIDFGVLGILFFGNLIWCTLKEVHKSLNELRNSPVATVALASAACIIMAIVSFPSGSPFLGIPMGALVWFFLGTLCKLADQYRLGSYQEEPPAPLPQSLPTKRFRFHQAGNRHRTPGARPE